VRAGIEVELIREPEGVIGIITPWNFPIAIPAWKIAPALAYGNGRLQAGGPGAGLRLDPRRYPPARRHAGGRIQPRHGQGFRRRRCHRQVRPHPGRQLHRFGSDRPAHRGRLHERGKNVQLELGGKDPLIIAADADLDVAVNVAINGSFFSTGQRCTYSMTARASLILFEICDRRFQFGRKP